MSLRQAHLTLTAYSNPPSYRLSYVAYATVGSTPWTSPTPVALPYGSPPTVQSLRIWQLPDSLVNLPRQPTAADRPPLPCLDLLVATVDESTGATETVPAGSYGWATQVGVTVRKLPALAPTPAAATTYELLGVDEHDVVLLERLLTAVALDAPELVLDRLLLLHAAGGGAAGLASDGDRVTTFVGRANLASATATAPGGAHAPADFVRLLRESSITRSGGFYLHYCADPTTRTGLPDSIFDDEGEAVLTMLLLYGVPSDRAQENRLGGYVNAAVTSASVEPSSAAVLAQARAVPAYRAAGPNDSLATLSGTYRMSASELAEANADVTLGATIVLPSGPTVAAGTVGRGTLAEVAASYGVTVGALAEANASQPGIFAGQTIEVAELITPGSDVTLADLADRYYMDPVQLVEDNADVPLAVGAKVAAPELTLQVGTSPGSATFGQIASFYGVPIAALALDNAGTAGLFTVPLRVRGGPLVREATSALDQPLHTDPIVGLSEWPGVTFDYLVVPGGSAGTAALEISVAFDGRASRDVTVYERIRDQLASGGLTVTVETSLLPGAPQTVDPAPLQAFAASIYEWLEGRVGGNTTAPLPTMEPISIPFELSAVETAQIFQLQAAVVLSRPPAFVDPDLRMGSKVARSSSTVPPHRSRETPGGPPTLTAFATSFEQALVSTGAWRLKLAVGVDRARAGGAVLWAVRLGLAGGQPLAFSVPRPDAPTAYAPRPVSNVLRTGSVAVRGYVSGSGLTGPATTLSFGGIDLDGWTAQLLAAVDRLLSPSYVAAIGLLDGKLPSGRTPHLQELATAKQHLAAALAQLVIPVLAEAAGPDPTAAREAFEQQLLVQLGSFSTTAAIVQLAVDTASQSTEPTTAPQLFGHLEQTSAQPAPVTLSDPKIPLAQASSTLTFLLGSGDVAQGEAEIALRLAFRGTDVEHQIGTLPGLAGSRASSWLSFVRAETPWPLTAALGRFDVPLVARGFPKPPTLRAQSATQTVPDGHPGLRLDQTLGWDYGLVYDEPFHFQQDTVHVTIELDRADGAVRSDEPVPVAAAGDPFAALAELVTVYPQLQQDVDAYVAPVDPSAQQFAVGDVALTTFAELAEQVAGTLAAASSPSALPAESYDFAIVEGTIRLRSLTGSGEVAALLVTVQDVPAKLGARVTVEIDGCTAQAPSGGGTSTSSYVYVDEATKDWLPARTGQTIGPRTVIVSGLNVLARQAAWASGWIGRNETFAEPFRYRTPTVALAGPQHPANLYTTPPIEVAAIGASSAQRRTPEQHLQALFAALFATAPAGEQTIGLECGYRFELASAGSESVDLPVYLLPPTPTDPAQDPLAGQLGGQMRTWWNESRPAAGGVFLLTLAVMSRITSQPLIVLRNLQLTEEWIDWS